MSKPTANSSTHTSNGLPPSLRVAIALLLPPLTAILLSSLAGLIRPTAASDGRAANALFLGSAGLASLLLGTVWYGLDGLGLRGKRPLYASIAFASMGWLVFLVARFFLVLNAGYGPAGATRAFIYLLLFEALAVQIWTFGLFFRALADWRGPLTAAIGSGILFGMVGFLFFEESFNDTWASLLYFLLWGIFYGVIRLRTGSLLGIVVVQALQSFTAWVVMVPASVPPSAQAMQMVYLIAGAAYIIFVWRLWPKQEADYRV
ncbi:MAG: CPBP family intramembrane metalloprotease [Ardenticatenaceae bacterium]|nr:CPBP family intramembrane metalloprotease [Ardenticatenaceae bacterium]